MDGYADVTHSSYTRITSANVILFINSISSDRCCHQNGVELCGVRASHKFPAHDKLDDGIFGQNQPCVSHTQTLPSSYTACMPTDRIDVGNLCQNCVHHSLGMSKSLLLIE